MKFCWMINDRIRMVDIGSDFVVAGNDVGYDVGSKPYFLGHGERRFIA